MKRNILLIISFFCTFQSFTQNLELKIMPVFGNASIIENQWYVTRRGDSIQFENIRFYISAIEFESQKGERIKDPQYARLIDVFEPSTLKISFNTLKNQSFKKMYFNIGIDSLTSVSGALGGDLDPQKGMYWAWQSGYINMKIEGKSPQFKTRKNVFQFHLGGYLQPFYAMRQVEMPIKSGVGFRVSDFGENPTSEITNPKYTEGGVLKIDLAKFFENITISTQNSIMIPCKEAMELADNSVKMFSIDVQQK